MRPDTRHCEHTPGRTDQPHEQENRRYGGHGNKTGSYDDQATLGGVFGAARAVSFLRLSPSQ